MRKHEKPVSHAPRAGGVVERVRVRSVWVMDDEQVPEPKPGKLNYLGGPAKKKPTQQHKKHEVEIEIRRRGHYIGDGKRPIAFVSDDTVETVKKLPEQ